MIKLTKISRGKNVENVRNFLVENLYPDMKRPVKKIPDPAGKKNRVQNPPLLTINVENVLNFYRVFNLLRLFRMQQLFCFDYCT